MSQVTQPRIPAAAHPAPTRAAWIGALLAVAAVAATALVIALGGGSSQDPAVVNVQGQPSQRADGGPEETGVAGAVGSHPVSAPSESAIAAAIGTSASPNGSAPDESAVAAAISAR